jgi:glycosyltransferase involved in cell wall biosynthesis
MRILVVTTSYPLQPGSMSGVFIRRLMDHMAAVPDLRLTVIVPDGCQPAELGPQATDRVDVRVVRYAPKKWQTLTHLPGGIFHQIRRKPLRIVIIPGLLAAMAIACFRIGRRCDLIHAHWSVNGVVAGLIGNLLGVPVVTTVRGTDVQKAGTSGPMRWLLGWCLRLNRLVIGVSRTMVSDVASLFPKHASKLVAVPNGIGQAFFNAATSAGPNEGRFRFAIIGNLTPEKDVATALVAFASLPNGQNLLLDVVGDGDQRPALVAQSIKLGIHPRVAFHGQVSPQRIPGILSRTDALVVCSRSEGRPNVVLEAMAAAVPVIGSDIDAISELVDHQRTGLLFHTGSPSALAEKMQLIRKDFGLRKTIAENARNWVVRQGATWHRAARTHAALYRSILNASHIKRH